MNHKHWLLLTGLMLLSGCAGLQRTDGLQAILAADAEVALVSEGYLFTEGPLGAADGGLYFTDLRENQRVHRMTPDGRISVVREKSGTTNGLAFTRKGELLGVEGTGKRVVRIAPDGTATELSSGDGVRPLMSPNDLIVDAKGGIYFTDPGPRPVVKGRRVFTYFLPAGSKQAVAVDDSIIRPNGLILTTDEKTLIVADTVGDTLFAFTVQPDGKLTNRRPFAKLRDIPPGEDSGGDGIAIDREDRLYVTSITGVQIFDRAGKYLGTIKVPKKPSNVAFAGPGKRTLYITAQQGLYKIDTLVQGPERLGK